MSYRYLAVAVAWAFFLESDLEYAEEVDPADCYLVLDEAAGLSTVNTWSLMLELLLAPPLNSPTPLRAAAERSSQRMVIIICSVFSPSAEYMCKHTDAEK